MAIFRLENRFKPLAEVPSEIVILWNDLIMKAMDKKRIIDDLLGLNLPIDLWSKVSEEKSEREKQFKEVVEKRRFAIIIMDEIDKETAYPTEIVRLSFFYNKDRNNSEDIAGVFFDKMPSYLNPIEGKVEFDRWVFPYENMVIPFELK